jgi:hypothetical protein
MKKTCICLITMILASLSSTSVYSQRKTGSENKITSSDLESYVSFLASPLLKGRKNGDEGLEIAAQYIASQAKLSGLKPAIGIYNLIPSLRKLWIQGKPEFRLFLITLTRLK